MAGVGRAASLTALCACLMGCASIPKGATSVTNFEKEKYLGTWYEIARFDFAFEKNLDNTTAEYSIGGRGGIKVVNSGHNYVRGTREVARGRARFRGAETVGELEVSFFGPFYAAYNIIALDRDYRYALVAGSGVNYLWILSREKTIPEQVRREYLAIAQRAGFDTDKLIWVEHDR